MNVRRSRRVSAEPPAEQPNSEAAQNHHPPLFLDHDRDFYDRIPVGFAVRVRSVVTPRIMAVDHMTSDAFIALIEHEIRRMGRRQRRAASLSAARRIPRRAAARARTLAHRGGLADLPFL